MKKKGLLLDAAAGFLLTLLASASYFTGEPLLKGVELKAYDMRLKLRQSLESPPEVAMVVIDDDSIASLGRWPWPRARMARALDKIAASGAKVIGLNVLYSEPEQNQGLEELRRLEGVYRELVGAKKIVQKGVDFAVEFSSASVELDSDAKLLASLRSSGQVVLPLFFLPSARGQAAAAVVSPPPSVSSAAVPADGVPESLPAENRMAYPIPEFAEAAWGLAHVNLYQDLDGVLRREAPLVRYGTEVYPSLALRLVLAYLGRGLGEVKIEPGRLAVGPLSVPLDEEGRMPVTFCGEADTVKRVSFRDVLGDSVTPDFFKDKIVLVGITATGVATPFTTPAGAGFPSLEFVANAVENVLHQKFLVRPPWAARAEWGLLALTGLFVMLLLPRLKALWGLVVSLLLALGMAGAGTWMFLQGQWVQVGYALTLLAAGYLVIVSRGLLVTEKGKELVEASAIETNKMLGLSFQGQGMLDLAFEKFRLCPLDEAMKELLYNLALDFERKRQFAKAAAVLEHVCAKDAKYKDAAERIKTLKAASEGAVFGGVGGARKEGTVMIAGGASKPTLGRYEIEKELGRGAMGVVYLGKDPKINRMVAIKTMMLEEGGDAGSVKELKERFFREAESAGTLNHPNIVRIFDAGEENEVAYIAMELLDGHDLTRYCAKDALLPMETALEYAAVVADALGYAHGQGVVHRDIKPANVMRLKDGSVRVADFGIARISASSKTATGTVMGTPSYMSPEQVAGKKVDGRSDLFSLSVALFEMLTGEKPFKGGEGIGTLLFQIANDPHPDVLSLRPDLPPALKAIIDKGLAKKPEDRFQTGAEMAAAIRSALSGKTAPVAAAASAAAPPAVAPASAVPAAAATIPSVPRPAPAAAAPPPAAVPAQPAAAAPPPAPRLVIPGLNDRPAAVPAAEKTIGPVIPGFGAPAPVRAPAPAPAPAAPAAAPAPAPAPAAPAPAPSGGGLIIELGTRAGTGSPAGVPPPPKPADETVRLPPAADPDATVRLPPAGGAP